MNFYNLKLKKKKNEKEIFRFANKNGRREDDNKPKCQKKKKVLLFIVHI